MIIILGTNTHEMSVAIRDFVAKEYPGIDPRFSHIAIVDGDDVIEARPPRGVVVTPLKVFKKAYPTWEMRELPGDVEKARLMIGMPYDFEGLIGMFIKNYKIQRPEACFCSEPIGVAADAVQDNEAHMHPPGYFVSISTWVDSSCGLQL